MTPNKSDSEGLVRATIDEAYLWALAYDEDDWNKFMKQLRRYVTAHTQSELEDLKQITRDYKEEYPDANFDDFIGIVSGKQATQYLGKDKK